MKTMLAARFHAPGEPLRLEDVPVPSVGPQEVLVRVTACGICGSDVHFSEGRAPVATTPITLGHEPAGIVAEVGQGVSSVATGQRVVVRPGAGCGSCPACAAGRDSLCERSLVLGMHVDGGLAEYLAADASNVIPVPDAVPLEQAAIISDAVATPYHALVDRGGLRAGESVAIFGTGGLGAHAVQLARLAGAATVIAVDVRASALERARRAGADVTINATEERPSRRIRALAGGVDLSLECVGRPDTIGEAVKSLRRGGRAVVVGMGPEPIQLPPPNAFTWSEHALIGSFGSTAEHVRLLLGMAASGRIDLAGSVTALLPLRDVNAGLDMLRSPEGDAGRVVVQPGSE